MVVEDYMNVFGRGWIIIAYGDELSHKEIHLGERIVRGDVTFTIKGVERSKYGDNWWANRVGLVLLPNNRVPDYFEVGQEIDITNKDD